VTRSDLAPPASTSRGTARSAASRIPAREVRIRLAATLARGKTRRPRAKVEAEIEAITAEPWVRRVITWQLSGDQPRDLRLARGIDAARAALEGELFGKHVLITDHDDWPAAEVIAAYRSQSKAEFSVRQLKDPHVVSFSPMHHRTEHNIRAHVFTCVLALQIAHLMRRKAAQARPAPVHPSAPRPARRHRRDRPDLPLHRGRPKARRMTTELTGDQHELCEIFELGNQAPRSWVIRLKKPGNPADQQEHLASIKINGNSG
jgi:hypothetical protein